MTRGVRWLCLAAVAVGIFVAGCGGGGSSSSSSTTTTTKAAKTTTTTTSKAATTTSKTTSKTTTTTAAAKTTSTKTSGGVVSLTPAEKAAALTACKNAAKTYTAAFGSQLPGNFASEINAICTKVASGDLKGAKSIEQAICNQVVNALPSGVAKSTVQAACKNLG